MQLPKLITFDCYGTLINWDDEAQRALNCIVLESGRNDLNALQLYRQWEEIEFRMIQGHYPGDKPSLDYRYKPYKDILVESLRAVLETQDLPTRQNERAFADSITRWAPFADVKPVLRELQRRTKIGILSNIDTNIIRESIKIMDIEFDVVVTAEEVRRYKPCLNHFCEVLNRTGLWNTDVLHVAFGFKYDIEPAKRLGIPCVWVRRGSPFEGAQIKGEYTIKPDYVVDDLYGLASIIRAAE